MNNVFNVFCVFTISILAMRSVCPVGFVHVCTVLLSMFYVTGLFCIVKAECKCNTTQSILLHTDIQLGHIERTKHSRAVGRCSRVGRLSVEEFIAIKHTHSACTKFEATPQNG